jgi:hypothetical protein
VPTFNQTDPVSFEAAQAMIVSDPALRDALERVNQLDFSMLKRKSPRAKLYPRHLSRQAPSRLESEWVQSG